MKGDKRMNDTPCGVTDMMFMLAGLPYTSMKEHSVEPPKTVWVVCGPPAPTKNAKNDVKSNIFPYYSQPIFIGRNL
jgi:hypothetical protein